MHTQCATLVVVVGDGLDYDTVDVRIDLLSVQISRMRQVSARHAR
jgi:hypothetical protein